MDALLEPREVEFLTDAKRKKTQIRVLRANGIVFFLSAAGWPRVPRAALEGRSTEVKKGWKPNKG